jgi:hypothetical protein
MKYRALVSTVKEYDAAPYDGPYFESTIRPEWQRLPSLTQSEIVDVVLTFLNSWQCRIPVTPKLVEHLSEAFRETGPLFRALAGQRLEATDLAAVVAAGSERLTGGRAIASIFDRLMAVGSRFSHVATVKTMHMVNPGLFVMWDNGILANHGHRQEPYGWFYAYRFLPKMQAEANEAIEDYRARNGGTRQEAVQAIERDCGDHKTLAKRLDEFNYVRRPHL